MNYHVLVDTLNDLTPRQFNPRSKIKHSDFGPNDFPNELNCPMGSFFGSVKIKSSLNLIFLCELKNFKNI